MQLSVGKPAVTAHTFRAVMSASSPAQMRALLAMTFYLRLQGVYAKVIPTMNTSAAHADEDVAAIEAGMERALLRMQRDGLVAAG